MGCMGKIGLAIILVMPCVRAQPFQDLLLRQSAHIAGVVVDPEGKPIVKASIDHSNDQKTHRTDSEGRFELDTMAPTLVVRKAGFRSEMVRTQEAAEIRVTLQKRAEPQQLPTCSGTGRYYGIDGWGASFYFPKTSGIKASGQGQDSDYGARSYYIETGQGRKGIGHGSGPMWSFGMPLDQHVWRSVKYEEATYDVGGLTIIDARGQLANGNRWRSLVKFGETASYSDVDEATAKILDRFLDGACLKPPRGSRVCGQGANCCIMKVCGSRGESSPVSA
jgi:hypothetical protein